MNPIRHLRQSVSFCLAAACTALAFAPALPAWSLSDDTAAEAARAADTLQRPTLPKDAAERVAELEERIEERKKAGNNEDLTAAIELAEEVVAIRLKHQGSEAGWTNVEGKPAQWYEVGDAQRMVEDLIRSRSLTPSQRGELVKAESNQSILGDLYSKGNYVEAFELSRKNAEIRRRILGDDHPQTLTSINNMGFLINAQGRHAEAEPYYRESLEGHRRVLGNDHPETLTAINNMGRLLDEQGKYDEVEPYYRESLEGCRRILGDDHPDTLISINNMGVLLKNQGLYTEAEPYYREALEGRRRVQGDDNLNTLQSINNMGYLLQAQGRYSEAEPYFREALTSSRRVLGDDHPRTLTSITSMGILLQSQGLYAKAEPYYREALEGSRRVLGDDHPRTLTTISNMGVLLESQGRFAEAEPYFRESMEGKRRVLGDDHPSTLVSISNMGSPLCRQGRFDEAEQYWQEALASHRRMFGDDHPDTLQSINKMGLLFRLQERFTEAEPLWRETLEGRRRVLGDDHPNTLISINNLGVLLRLQGRYAEAEPLWREVLETRRRLLGNDHPDTALSLSLYAGGHYDRGDYAAAESMWLEAAKSFEAARLQVSSSGLGRVQFATKWSPLLPLAACLARNSKPRSAWRYLEESMARGLFDALSVRHTRPLDTGERNQEEDLIHGLNTLDERISATLRTKEETGDAHIRLRHLRNTRERLQAELVTFEAEMSEKYSVVAGEVYRLDQIRKQLPDDVALLAWVDVKGDPHAADPNGEHWACVVRRDGEPSWIRLPGSGKDGTWTEEDDELAHLVRRELSHWAAGPSAQWRQELIRLLHAQRIAPLEPHMNGIHRLIVLPAGKMAGVPIEALTDAYTISYAPSGTMYAWLREKTPPDRPSTENSGSLLALGDPSFPKPAEPGKPLHELPDHGVLIAMVAPESNALRSGLQEGDVLLSYGDSDLRGPDEIGPAIQKAQEQTSEANDASETTPEIPVNVWRKGETLELAVEPGRLGVRPAQQPAPEAILTQHRLDQVMESTRSSAFNSIPHTRHEVEAIAGLFTPSAGMAKTDTPKESILVLLGSEASEQRVHALAKAGELKNYRYLHLATHGVMDDRIAMNSAMILSQDDLPDAFEQAVAGKEIFDGRLTAEQIVRTWKLDADLVTLSGCETALGEESGGEGFLGFSQALFVAGARSLLLSLWKVDDQTTMLLMKRFYENLLGKYDEARRMPDRDYSAGTPMPKAEALREAKLWLRNLTVDQLEEMDLNWSRAANRGTISQDAAEAKPMVQHPYEDPQYWASFILIGDPE